MVIYGVIAVSVVLENFFPPSPSDVFVVFAAFLVHRGSMDPLTIFLVAWGFGTVGAIVVYSVVRKFGRRFFAGRVGQRLISPGTFAAIEREYLRFGVLGMFLFRMLPAFRSVVAPFAGFVNLSPARAILPITIACAVWYGGLVLLGTTLGSEWGAIRQAFGRLNQGLGILALIALGFLVLWGMRRRRESRRARLAVLRPFDPANPDQPAPMEQGLPRISAEELEEARRAHRRADG
ncbi:MAG TPA: DedA family protein [Gemmatimonadales bacterium]|nr:DedA family protein [Gemmatimonadales bacterium]